MKKQNVVNLIKYHAENNNEAFISEVAEIARDFDANGELDVYDLGMMKRALLAQKGLL